MARRKRYGLTSDSHHAMVAQASDEMQQSIRTAQQAYGQNDCRRMGQAIDDGWTHYGEGLAHLSSMEGGSTSAVGSDLGSARNMLRRIDNVFEKRCVLVKPSSTALGRYKRRK